MSRTRLVLLVVAGVVSAAVASLYFVGASLQTPFAPATGSDTMASAHRDALSNPSPAPPPPSVGAAMPPPPPGAGQGAPPPDDAAPAEPPNAAAEEAAPPRDMTYSEEESSQALTGGAAPPTLDRSSGSGGSSLPAIPPPPPPLGPKPTLPAPKARAEPVPAPQLAPASATESAPAMPQDIPIFPWPVPKASAAQEIPRKLVVAADASPTFGTVAARLARALDRAGYNQHSYYAFADGHGVAIATQLEQINDDGSPKPGEARFQLKLAPLSTAEFSLASYVKALFSARSGRFRVIVFALSQGVAQDAAAPGAERAKTWATSGQTKLPARYAALAFGDAVACTALIYEFEKKDYNADAQFVVPGKIDAMAHLTKAGIWTLLGK